MKVHALRGLKQTLEHIRKRMESVARTKAAWTDERRAEYVQKVREANLRRDPELKRKFMFCHVGKEPWNKGKICPQISANHWNRGGQMSQESIEKMRQSLTGKKQSEELIAKRFAARAGYRHSEETKAKISQANSGEGNGNWLGGLTPYSTTYFKARDAIRDRDGHRCVICNVGENGHRHDVHHIDYDKKNLDAKNLVTLCHFCHGKTNHNRETWRFLFGKTLTRLQPSQFARS